MLAPAVHTYTRQFPESLQMKNQRKFSQTLVWFAHYCHGELAVLCNSDTVGILWVYISLSSFPYCIGDIIWGYSAVSCMYEWSSLRILSFMFHAMIPCVHSCLTLTHSLQFKYCSQWSIYVYVAGLYPSTNQDPLKGISSTSTSLSSSVYFKFPGFEERPPLLLLLLLYIVVHTPYNLCLQYKFWIVLSIAEKLCNHCSDSLELVHSALRTINTDPQVHEIILYINPQIRTSHHDHEALT